MRKKRNQTKDMMPVYQALGKCPILSSLQSCKPWRRRRQHVIPNIGNIAHLHDIIKQKHNHNNQWISAKA